MPMGAVKEKVLNIIENDRRHDHLTMIFFIVIFTRPFDNEYFSIRQNAIVFGDLSTVFKSKILALGNTISPFQYVHKIELSKTFS